MRTTIELSEEQRARLLELAAQRGEKGFSSIVQEALEHYFASRADRRELVEEARRAIGSLGDDEAEELREDVRKLRERWR